MYFQSKKTQLLILGVTSIIFSRMMFVFFNDPEGPNLLVVAVAAIIVYFLSLPVYLFTPSEKLSNFKRLMFTILIQIIIVTGFYFFLS